MGTELQNYRITELRNDGNCQYVYAPPPSGRGPNKAVIHKKDVVVNENQSTEEEDDTEQRELLIEEST